MHSSQPSSLNSSNHLFLLSFLSRVLHTPLFLPIVTPKQLTFQSHLIHLLHYVTYLTLGLPSVLHCTALPLDTEEKPKSSIQWVPSDSLPIEVNTSHASISPIFLKNKVISGILFYFLRAIIVLGAVTSSIWWVDGVVPSTKTSWYYPPFSFSPLLLVSLAPKPSLQFQNTYLNPTLLLSALTGTHVFPSVHHWRAVRGLGGGA